MESWGEIGYCSSKEARVVCNILSNGNTEEGTRIHTKGWQIYFITPNFSGTKFYLRARLGTQKTGTQNQSEPSYEKQLETYYLNKTFDIHF